MKNELLKRIDELTNEGSVFNSLLEDFMEDIGEGETLASQFITSVNNILYRYLNGGDFINGYYNEDVYTYANWIDNHFKSLSKIFDAAEDIQSDDEKYLKEVLIPLLEFASNRELLLSLSKEEKDRSIYEEGGRFCFEMITIEDDYEDEYEEF